MKLKVDIWHNILWSKYKGAVFSELHSEAVAQNIDIRFFQIAETESDRRGLSDVDHKYHRYPYELITKGAYQERSALWLIKELCKRTFLSDAEIIVIAGYHRIEYWAQLMTARMTNKKAMVFCDSTYLDKPRHLVKDFLKRQFFRFCDGFFCYGQRSMEYLLTYGVPSSKIFFRCQAAALPLNYTPSIALKERIRVLQGGLPKTFLFVGRLAPEKNIPMLLEAFHQISKTSPDVILKLVGDGPERRPLEELVTRLNLEAKVIFVGPLSGELLFREYVTAAALVLPSKSEPWGLVVNESLSYGCPVVVSKNCGCVPELVLDGITGFKFNTFSREDLESKMASIIDPEFNNELTARSCTVLLENFTPRKAGKSIVDGLISISLR